MLQRDVHKKVPVVEMETVVSRRKKDAMDIVIVETAQMKADVSKNLKNSDQVIYRCNGPFHKINRCTASLIH